MNIINSVTKEGISYVDSNGIEGFVDFKQCNDNWIKYRKRKEDLSDDRINEIRKLDKCIGQRDISESASFVELFTRPFIRFEFIKSEIYLNPIEASTKLKDDIINAGWSTIDLS